MSYTKDQLLSRLQELEVAFSRYDHPAVLTVEAQAKYVGNEKDEKGALSKNLFLKDKKNRYYIVSALASTKVDLKVLSQRLGLGKGGVRMAPEESLGEILQVPLGCVTPFALVNDSARRVSLILDKGFQDQECCFFHPLSNDTSISVNSQDLDKFLASVQMVPAYVDLEANPSVGKDQPPDLAALVPSDVILLPENAVKAVPSRAPENNITTVNNLSAPVSAKPGKPSKDGQKEKATDPCLPFAFSNQEKFVEDILEKTSGLIISEINEETLKQDCQQLGTLVSSSIKKHLTSDFISLATTFKNAAYLEGFQAGTQQRGYRCP